MSRLTVGIIICLSFCVLAANATAGDMIQKKSGGWLPTEPMGPEPTREELDNSTITVISEDYDYVWYKFKDIPARQKLETAKIARVVYGDRTQLFMEAANAMGGGDLDTALAKFQTIVKARKSNRPWMVMYSMYNIGRIYQDGRGMMEEAIQAWKALEKAFPKSKYVPDAIIKAGLAYLAIGDSKSAEGEFRRLQRLRDLAEGKKQIGKYYVIFIKQRSGQVEEALREYRQLLSLVEKDSDLKEVAIRARLGIGDCLLSLKKFGEALSFFQKIADASEDPAVLAGAFNGLGRCHFEQQNWKMALMSFLRTVVLYDESPDQTAMALCYAADSYTYLRSEDWKSRAKALFRECMARFPGTEWAKKSKELLPKAR